MGNVATVAWRRRTSRRVRGVTLFAFFHQVNIVEQLFSNVADGINPSTSPMSIFKDGGHWNHLSFENAVVKMQELSLLRFSHCNEREIISSFHGVRNSNGFVCDLTMVRNAPFLCHLHSIGHIDDKTRQEGQAHLDTIW